MHISITGKVSVGKSSFVNSFHSFLYEKSHPLNCWTPFATISIQRETFNPNKYLLKNTSCDFNYDKEQEKNRKLRDVKLKDIVPNILEIKPQCFIESITDFPGFDDSNDSRDIMANILENMGDITIFITDAYRAFIDKSEQEYFNKIIGKSKKLNENGVFNRVIIVANKYDHEDVDLREIFDKIKHNNKFRWCSYARFKHLEIKEKSKANGVSSVCDIDNLMTYLNSINLKNEKYECLKKHTLKLDRIEKFDDIFINDVDIHKKYTIMFINNRTTQNLPQWAFNENRLITAFMRDSHKMSYCDCYTCDSRYFFKIIYILNIFKVNDLYSLKPFIKKHSDKITIEPVATINTWKNIKCFEFIESYHVHCGMKSLIEIKPFPIEIIDYFKLDLKKILEDCYYANNRTLDLTVYF